MAVAMVDTFAPCKASATVAEPLRIVVYSPEDWAGAQLHHAAIETAYGAGLVVDELEGSDVAIAPLLKRKLTEAQWSAPRHGTLIFHPSLLPLYRGPDAVRWVVKNGEKFTGATWFWCSEGMDEGDIWEQQMVAVPPSITPGALYFHKIVPAAVRCLERGLRALMMGYIRRVPQDQVAATYFRRMPDKW